MTDFTVPDSLPWRRYRVTLPKGEKGRSFELSPWVNRFDRYRMRGFEVEVDGQPTYVEQREELLKDGTRIDWTFLLDPVYHWTRTLEKRIVGPTGDTLSDCRFQYAGAGWGYPDRLCHVTTIHCPLLYADLKEGARFEFNLLATEEAMPWKIHFHVDHAETIKVPAGKIRCYRVSLQPDFKQILGRWSWMSRVIRPFVPDFHFWVERESPHTLVKFEGRLGPVGASSIQVHEFERTED